MLHGRMILDGLGKCVGVLQQSPEARPPTLTGVVVCP